MNKTFVRLVGTTLATSSLLVGGTAFAAGPDERGDKFEHGLRVRFETRTSINEQNRPDLSRGIAGSVIAVQGSTITIRVRGWQRDDHASTTTVYTVNASGASIKKGLGPNAEAGTLADVTVGSRVVAEGTVSGTSVVATAIRVKAEDKKHDDDRPKLAGFVGNGQPVVGGVVTAVSGSTITVTNKGNATYTVDTSRAIFVNKGATSTVSSIGVGDAVIVQGTITGNTVVAATILEKDTQGTDAGGEHRGFFKKFGSFFRGVFGFF